MESSDTETGAHEAAVGDALAKVRRIVVHGGLAHVDDIMACALAYAFGVPHDAQIERRNPTSVELADVSTLVMDVGGVHDPSRLDFDHHQRPRAEEPKCAFKLLGEWLGVDAELATLFPWYSVWNAIDVLGPFAAARQMGTSWGQIEGIVDNPLVDFVVRRFADDPSFRCKTARTLGNGIALTRRLWGSFREKLVARTLAGLPVADFTACAAEEISRCSDAWIRLNSPACIVSRDSRGAGLTILRCNDDPRLDFTRCAGRPYAAYCHPGGFLLKTVSLSDDPEEAVRDARVRSSDAARPV